MDYLHSGYWKDPLEGYSTLFEVFPALSVVELHTLDLDIQVREGGEPEEAERKPDEWKDEKWLHGV